MGVEFCWPNNLPKGYQEANTLHGLLGAALADTELVMQKISLVPLFGHLVTAVAAGVVAARKGKSPWLPAVKVGGLRAPPAENTCH